MDGDVKVVLSTDDFLPVPSPNALPRVEKFDWEKELYKATTLEEFEVLKPFIRNDGQNPAKMISNPVVLRFFLEHYSLPKKILCKWFYDFARLYLARLMEVILDFIPLIEVVKNDRLTFDGYVYEVIREGYVDVMTTLLDRGGVDILYPEALSNACEEDKIDIINLFLDRGVNPNTTGHYDLTPTHYAIICTDNVRILDKLIVHGANLHTVYPCGNSLLITALINQGLEEGREIIQRLVDMKVPYEDDIIARIWKKTSPGYYMHLPVDPAYQDWFDEVADFLLSIGAKDHLKLRSEKVH